MPILVITIQEDNAFRRKGQEKKILRAPGKKSGIFILYLRYNYMKRIYFFNFQSLIPVFVLNWNKNTAPKNFSYYYLKWSFPISLVDLTYEENISCKNNATQKISKKDQKKCFQFFSIVHNTNIKLYVHRYLNTMYFSQMLKHNN